MSTYKFILILSFFLSSQSLADEWTHTDTALELIYLIVTNKDRQQTLDCSRTPRCSEHNPLLGRNPSENKINLSITTAAIAHVWIATKIDQPYRRLWQFFWIGVEYDTTNRNESKHNSYHAGIKLQF